MESDSIRRKVVLVFCTYFFISTNAQDEAENGISYRHITLNPTNTDCSRKTIIFLFHGWSQTWDIDWYTNLTQAYFLNANSTNTPLKIVQVDWSNISNQTYFQSVRHLSEIGPPVALYIVRHVKNLNGSLSDIHLIGHSLGAHAAGIVGEEIHKMTKLDDFPPEQIGRITGLDPAGPLFTQFQSEGRLSLDDAQLVVILHTDGRLFGYMDPMGHIDVYINGGIGIQPGCLLFTDLYCSHHVSYKIFAYAIEYGNYYVTKCNDYYTYSRGNCAQNTKINIGGTLSIDDKGIYYN